MRNAMHFYPGSMRT